MSVNSTLPCSDRKTEGIDREKNSHPVTLNCEIYTHTYCEQSIDHQKGMD